MQTKSPDVSIIIVTRDGGRMLVDCVDSVVRANPDAEIILVDNASSDGSPAGVVRAHPGVRLIENKVNEGFARAVNRGLAVSTGRNILLLNNDTIVPPGAIAGMSRYLDTHPDCGVVGPQLLNEDGSRQHSHDNIPTIPLILLNKSLLRRLFPERYPSKAQETGDPVEVESVIGAALMIRRDVVGKVGPLDEEYFIFLEETDWCLRARRAGWKVIHLPSCGIVHLQGRTKRRRPGRAKVEYTRSLLTFARKHSSRFAYLTVRTLLPFKVGVNCAALFVCALLTLFLAGGLRERFLVQCRLLWWFLLFCPPGMGLSGRG